MKIMLCWFTLVFKICYSVSVATLDLGMAEDKWVIKGRDLNLNQKWLNYIFDWIYEKNLWLGLDSTWFLVKLCNLKLILCHTWNELHHVIPRSCGWYNHNEAYITLLNKLPNISYRICLAGVQNSIPGEQSSVPCSNTHRPTCSFQKSLKDLMSLIRCV